MDLSLFIYKLIAKLIDKPINRLIVRPKHLQDKCTHKISSPVANYLTPVKGGRAIFLVFVLLVFVEVHLSVHDIRLV